MSREMNNMEIPAGIVNMVEHSIETLRAGDAAAYDFSGIYTALRLIEFEDRVQEVLELLKAAFAAGSLRAGRLLGSAYASDFYQNVPVDAALGVEYFRKTVELGESQADALIPAEKQAYHEARMALFECMMEGVGMEADPDGAYKMLFAMEDNPLALSRIGLCYDFGEGTEADIEKAAAYYRKAAEIDSPEAIAQFNLAMCLMEGRGTEQDEAEAFRYLKMAEESPDFLEEMEEFRMRVYTELADCYENGVGTEADPEKAVAYYRLAGELGLPDADAIIAEIQGQ